MKSFLFLVCLATGLHSGAQSIATTAERFLASLDAAQKAKVLHPFESEERYNFHFFPKEDRKGISLNELNSTQKKAAFALLQSSLSKRGVEKAMGVTQLENVLRTLEKRSATDHYRDSGKYYVAIFGVPGAQSVWGWRFEGHHLSFTFSAEKNKLVSGTPAFIGSNPAIVPSGPQAGKQVLKEEADAGFALLHALSGAARQKALIDTTAPNEIITFVSRKALLENTAGVSYSQLAPAAQQKLLQLVGVYVHRYTKLFADAMLQEIETAGLQNLYFAWAGATEPQIGKPHYYRIQGPTFIIEYDNSQNGANHVHSVLRDLKHDFGGDLLLQHYKAAHEGMGF